MLLAFGKFDYLGWHGAPMARDAWVLSGSQKATLKYMAVAAILLLGQTVFGAGVAHYRADPGTFYGIDLSKFFPSNLLRTWHLQSAIFWIATSYVAGALFVAELAGPHEPARPAARHPSALRRGRGRDRRQHAGRMGRPTAMAAAQLVLVRESGLGISWRSAGSGRFCSRSACCSGSSSSGARWRPRAAIRNGAGFANFFLIAAFAIPLFYLPALFFGSQTNYTIVDAWRFWIIHLWVEGFFEFFVTVIVAVIFYEMGLVQRLTALRTIYLDAILYFGGGLIGTGHHWYWTGQTELNMALSATFSALEVVPLTLITLDAWDFVKVTRGRQAVVDRHRWTFYFLMAVGFWNFVGAGVFGFLINTPIVSYYEVGTLLTPNHGHAAMMGVFGMLGAGLMVFVLRETVADEVWARLSRLVRVAFWGLNIGLAMMVVFSLFPAGLMQVRDVIQNGYWHARSLPTQPRPLLARWNGCGCRVTWCSCSRVHCRLPSHWRWATSRFGGARENLGRVCALSGPPQEKAAIHDGRTQ